MKKLAAGTAAILALPLAVLAVLYVCGTDILSDPDFWYGYMAFFGTVVLGAIAIAQNGRANDINGELMKLQNEAQMLQIKEKASPVDFEPVRIDKETDGYVVRDNMEEFSVTNQKYKYAFFIESPHVKRENRELFNFVMELENISGMILKEISISSFKLYDIITNKSNVTAEKEKIREYPYNGDCVIKCILKPGEKVGVCLKIGMDEYDLTRESFQISFRLSTTSIYEVVFSEAVNLNRNNVVDDEGRDRIYVNIEDITFENRKLQPESEPVEVPAGRTRRCRGKKKSG